MKNRGFTLIELLIVIAIIGILGAIALGAYSEHRNKTRTKSLDNKEYNEECIQQVTQPDWCTTKVLSED